MSFISRINEICISGKKRRLYAFAYLRMQLHIIAFFFTKYAYFIDRDVKWHIIVFLNKKHTD